MADKMVNQLAGNFQGNLKVDNWLNGRKINEVLTSIEAEVREKPTDFNTRWLLFEILCLLGHWQRAIKTLQICAQLDKGITAHAQLMRKLIINEIERSSVMSGLRDPSWIIESPEWALGLVNAIKLVEKVNQEAADVAREKALNHAPLVACQSNLGDFSWLSDCDSRFGPICEVFASGHYCWLPFSDIKEMQLTPPSTVLDLIWRDAKITLHDQTVLSAFVHSRYPVYGEVTDKQLLSRETVWKDLGKTAVIGSGQKTWMHEDGDFGLLELEFIKFLP